MHVHRLTYEALFSAESSIGLIGSLSGGIVLRALQ